LPAARAHAAIELRAEKANGRDRFDIHISKSSFEYRISLPAAWPERRGQTPSEEIFSFYFNELSGLSLACKRRWHAACIEESTWMAAASLQEPHRATSPAARCGARFAKRLAAQSGL